MRQLLPQLQQPGVTISYKIQGQLMHCRNPIEEELMWILLYDDNISLVCDDMDCLRTPVTLMDTTFTNRGVTISTKKDKSAYCGAGCRDSSWSYYTWSAMSQSSGKMACDDDPDACQLRNRLPGSFTCCLPGLLRVSAVSAQTTLSGITRATIWVTGLRVIGDCSNCLNGQVHQW